MSELRLEDSVEAAVQALRAGRAAVLPTDTVYGLCAAPEAEAVRALYQLKGRMEQQPTALLASNVDRLLERVPELRGRPETIARALLPGAFTLIFANPARRFPWLTGSRADTIGVRVPDLPGTTRQVLEQIGAVAATSANLPGEPDPATLGDVPEEILAGAGAALDAGRLPGVPSTVLDLTGPEPRIVREGAVPEGESLEFLRRVG
jgi:L-threonylcarbamoyladenylate synthase